MLRLHFAGLQDGQPVVPLAHACGVGEERHGSIVDAHRFDTLFDHAPEFWRVVNDIRNADVVIYPHQYRPGPEAEAVGNAARRAGLPCIFFRTVDDVTPVPPPYGIVYRESILSDRQAPGERAMPAFCDDFLRDIPRGAALREKKSRPSVGFCGYVGNRLNRTVYRLSGRKQKVYGLGLRHNALRALDRHRGVECQFVRRKQFWGGAYGRFGRDLDRQLAVRMEYVNNLFATDYTLCLRGAGNFSYRFYEVLSAGRIPLFVNTHCVLPFSDRIDWRRHCVWVEESELSHAGEILADFHASLSPSAFRELQEANRALWEEWLSPLGAYRHLLDDVVDTADVGESTGVAASIGAVVPSRIRELHALAS